MKSEVLTQATNLWPQIFALFIFIAVFVGACLWIFRKNSAKVYDEMANIPLEKGQKR